VIVVDEPSSNGRPSTWNCRSPPPSSGWIGAWWRS